MTRCETYTPQNCTAGACELAPWIPERLGDGGDWAANYAARGGTVTMIPTAGSVVCYARGGGYSAFGHVAYVEDVYPDGTFLVREENFSGLGQWDERRSTMADVAGFLLAPGAVPGEVGTGSGEGPGGSTGAGVPSQVNGAWEVLRWWCSQGHDYELWRQQGTERARQSIPI